MRNKLLMSLVASSVFLGAGPAAAQYAAYPDGRQPAYYTTLYSDASYTTVVGYISPECGFREVQYSLSGTYSVYGVDEFVGYCTENGWDPL